MSLFESASLCVTPNGTKASKLYAVKPVDGSGDLSVTRATTATRVNSAGLIESVASNVPRLDYSNGTCPSILVEPQRTNLLTYSEQFDNASWERATSGSATISVTSNATTAPNGTTTADLVTINRSSVSEISLIYKVTNTPAGTYKGSVWLKAKDSASVGKTIDLWSWDGNTNGYTKVTLTADWKRHEQATTVFSGTGQELFDFGLLSNTYSTSTTLSVEFYIWGVQSEAGSYATSYIPTTSASVTRNADVISKTGISSLIGQTEGTIFVEEVYDATIANNGGLDDTLVSLTDGTSSNLISIFHYGLGIGNVLFFIRLSGTTQVAISSSTPTSGTYKIALAYKNNDVVGYINGVQIATDTSATIPATSAITLVDPITTNAATKTVKRKNVAVWKTRLSNGELSTLTTI